MGTIRTYILECDKCYAELTDRHGTVHADEDEVLDIAGGKGWALDDEILCPDCVAEAKEEEERNT